MKASNTSDHDRACVVLDLSVQQLVDLPVALLALDAAVTRHPARPAELELALLLTPARNHFPYLCRKT